MSRTATMGHTRGRAVPVVVGIPDNGQVKLDAAGDVRGARFVVPGTAVFHNYLPRDVQERLPLVYCSRSVCPIDARSASPLINLSADPDVARGALLGLADVLARSGAPCFNHPMAVLASGRHDVASRLQGIPGVLVPRTIAARVAEPDDLLQAIAEAGLQWPVIVRIAGVHSGGSTVYAASAAELPARLAGIPWGGRTLYVTEFVPYADGDGMHRKVRIVIVGSDAILRHQITASGWEVHAGDHDPRYNAEERDLFARFQAEIAPRLADRLRAITDVMALDFFGIDCSLRPNGDLLVFECNAAMNVMRERRMMPTYAGVGVNRPEDVQAWRDSVRQVQTALVELLFAPARWRFPGPAAAPG